MSLSPSWHDCRIQDSFKTHMCLHPPHTSKKDHTDSFIIRECSWTAHSFAIVWGLRHQCNVCISPYGLPSPSSDDGSACDIVLKCFITSYRKYVNLLWNKAKSKWMRTAHL